MCGNECIPRHTSRVCINILYVHMQPSLLVRRLAQDVAQKSAPLVVLDVIPALASIVVFITRTSSHETAEHSTLGGGRRLVGIQTC